MILSLTAFPFVASRISCALKFNRGAKAHCTTQLIKRTINKMVDYDKPTGLQRNEPCPKTYGNQGWTYGKQTVMGIIGFEPPTGAVREYLSNRPTVLLSNDRGVERIGKRDDERSVSGVCTRAERK